MDDALLVDTSLDINGTKWGDGIGDLKGDGLGVGDFGGGRGAPSSDSGNDVGSGYGRGVFGEEGLDE